MNTLDSFIDPDDQLTARLVMAVGVLMNLLDCLDDLGIEPRGAANREAEAILKALGPAAVTCALLQGSEELRKSEHAEGAVNLYVQAALRRRESFLAAFPVPQRRAIEQRESERQCGPDRVLQLFADALAGMKQADVLQRWGSGGGLGQLSAAVAAASRGEEVDLEALKALASVQTEEVEDDTAADSGDGSGVQPMPEDLLQVVGGVLAGVGADAHMLDRVLGEVIAPPSVPDGYDADAVGTVRRSTERVGRNDPCPCGSGRKFKKCCGP